MQEQEERISIKNAGVAILSPYLSRLFGLLGLTKDNQFVNEDSCVRANFLIQYLIYGEEKEYPEHELTLNKIMTGAIHIPLPLSVELNEEEKNTCHSLLEGVKNNWEKLKNTSIEGLREGFLNRDGILEKKADHWELNVEQKAYDMLLDSLPWSYSPIRYAWMDTYINVKWRN